MQWIWRYEFCKSCDLPGSVEDRLQSDVTRSLIEIAYQWVKVDKATADELPRGSRAWTDPRSK